MPAPGAAQRPAAALPLTGSGAGQQSSARLGGPPGRQFRLPSKGLPLRVAEKKKEKKLRNEKRSIVLNRHLLFRVLSYMLPYKKAILLAISAAFMSGFLAAVSLLPMIPVIQMVLNPEMAAEREDRFERSRVHDETALEARQRQLEDSAGDAVDSFKERFGFVKDIELWLSARKDKGREEIQEFLINHRENAINWIVAFIIIATVVKAFLEYQAKYNITKIIYCSLQKLKVDLYASCLELDMAALQVRTSGNLIARLSSDVGQVRQIMQSSLSQSIMVPFQVIFLLVVLLIISAKITLITVVAVPLVVVPIALLGKALRRMSKADAEEDAYLIDVMQETIQGMQIVKAFNTEKQERKRFKRVSRDQLRRQIRRMRLRLASDPVVDILTTAAMGAVLIIGGYVVMKKGAMDAAEFIVYLIALTRFYKPLKGLSSGFVKIQKGLASAERIYEIIDAIPGVVEKPDAIHLPPLSGRIEFKDVSFSYTQARNLVLHEISLVIPKGKVYALVGSSGSGKSTMVRLLPRFYDPVNGRILVDGHDLRDVTFRSLREQIAIVTQETILFDSTIFYNIAYGKRNATMEEVQAAAEAANAHQFISDLPDGYDTRIGERGSQLSGGQRQRIAIARALLRNAPILILDEATSSLDNESESLVQEALERLMKERTVIVIAHRLSTVRNADKLIVMHEGRVVETGTHQELLARNGRYAELCNTELTRDQRNRLALEAEFESDSAGAEPQAPPEDSIHG